MHFHYRSNTPHSISSTLSHCQKDIFFHGTNESSVILREHEKEEVFCNKEWVKNLNVQPNGAKSAEAMKRNCEKKKSHEEIKVCSQAKMCLVTMLK